MAQPAILDALRERLARRSEVLEAYCFGSQARGDAAAHSDLDVAVYVDRGACRRRPLATPPSSPPGRRPLAMTSGRLDLVQPSRYETLHQPPPQ